MRSTRLAVALRDIVFAFAALAATGLQAADDCASLGAAALPAQVPQGGIVRGRVPAGSELSMLTGTESPGSTALAIRQLRVGSVGEFVFGVGRDDSGPLRLHLATPQGLACDFELNVTVRDWKLERVDGVPESTVEPPPAIAARIEREQALVAKARERDDDRNDFTTGFDWPLTGRISGVYGSQRIYNGKPKSPHSGLDVAAPKGKPVLAPAGGIITFANPDLYLTGGTVLVDHGHGLSSSFLHLSRIDVRVGQRVEKGQAIGLVGATGRATGPHMHWGMNWFGVRVDPQLLVDPTLNPAVSQASAPPSR
ncbi:MAG: M23 family metallopeptidase [Gammaproteobacteria bacterium]|nr:M23 family metallopeptidase [Gammaproteobacteria bacterium]